MAKYMGRARYIGMDEWIILEIFDYE